MTDRPGLTPKQNQVLAVITDFIREAGYGPSYRDIARAVGDHSLSGVHACVRVLITRGYLVADTSMGRVARRSIAIAQNGPAIVTVLVRPDGKYLRSECTGDVTIKVRTVFPQLEGSHG